MLDKANGINCQASNFLRSFRQIPQAAGLGLLENPVDDQTSLVRLTETFNRFILEQLHKESISNKPVREQPQVPIIDQLFGSTSLSRSKCLSCKHMTSRETRSFQYDLTVNEAAKNSNDSFVSLLRSSIARESHTKAWCDKCARYQLTEQKRYLTTLPNILCINSAAATSKADMDFWKSKIETNENSWLPLRLQLTIDTQTNELQLADTPKSLSSTDEHNAVYELTAVISHIYDQSKKASKHSHLVTQIKVHPSYHELHSTNPSSSEWYLFNDFHILPCEFREVIDFRFKTPCVLYYTRADVTTRIPSNPVVPLSEDVLFAENPIKTRSNFPLSFTPLTRDMVPLAGDIVAIDAEFVSLGAEETEIRSDGSRAVINPCHFGLARVSVIHGRGSNAGAPFIDDYIVTSEPIVDYLTRYSGIVPGDLDPKVSKHHVTSLKAAYLKLRYLVDLGCKFVGHGLAKDFRIINILVPPEQILDTVELYHLQDQRKISLRFLASCLLNIDIQTETHCSIEDARTALALYDKHLELEAENKFQQVLQSIYDLGRRTKWTVPDKDQAQNGFIS